GRDEVCCKEVEEVCCEEVWYEEDQREEVWYEEVCREEVDCEEVYCEEVYCEEVWREEGNGGGSKGRSQGYEERRGLEGRWRKAEVGLTPELTVAVSPSRRPL